MTRAGASAPALLLLAAGSKDRDKARALKFMKRLMKRHGRPKAITTEGLGSYKAAMNEIGNADSQEVGRWANNRAETACPSDEESGR